MRWLAIIQITRCRASTNGGKKCRHLRGYSCRVPCTLGGSPLLVSMLVLGSPPERDRPGFPAHAGMDSPQPGTVKRARNDAVSGTSGKFLVILAASGLYFSQGARDSRISYMRIDMSHYGPYEVRQPVTFYGTRRNWALQIVTPELRKREDKVV